MNTKLPAEIRQAIQRNPQGVRLEDEQTHAVYVVIDEEMHRRAMQALREQEDHAAIREGLADMEAGRVTPLAEVHAKLRQKLSEADADIAFGKVAPWDAEDIKQRGRDRLRLTEEQLQSLPQGLPVEVTAADGSIFYLLSADQYGKVRALFNEELDPRSMYPHMSKTFEAAGWDDPEMDVYDTLDPRRES